MLPHKRDNRNGLQSLSFLFPLCAVGNFHSPHVLLLYLYDICQNKYCSPFIWNWYCTGPSQIKQSEVRKVEMNRSFKPVVLRGVIYIEVFPMETWLKAEDICSAERGKTIIIWFYMEFSGCIWLRHTWHWHVTSGGFAMSRGSFTQSSDPYWTEKTHEFLIENNRLANHFPGLSKEKYVPMAVLAPKDVYLNAFTSNHSPKCPAEEDRWKLMQKSEFPGATHISPHQWQPWSIFWSL